MNFERILFANLAYRKCLGNIDAEDADKMKYDANDMTKARDTILDTLRHCYLDEFMGFLGGYHTYWVASDMELEILREQQERMEENMRTIAGKGYKEPNTCKVSILWISNGKLEQLRR